MRCFPYFCAVSFWRCSHYWNGKFRSDLPGIQNRSSVLRVNVQCRLHSLIHQHAKLDNGFLVCNFRMHFSLHPSSIVRTGAHKNQPWSFGALRCWKPKKVPAWSHILLFWERIQREHPDIAKFLPIEFIFSKEFASFFIWIFREIVGEPNLTLLWWTRVLDLMTDIKWRWIRYRKEIKRKKEGEKNKKKDRTRKVWGERSKARDEVEGGEEIE